MNKKLSFLLAGASSLLAALLFSCSDNNAVESDGGLIENKASLHVAAVDLSDKSLLAAKVTLRSTGESKKISVPKAAVFSGLPAGDHLVLVEMQGYASIVKTATIDNASNTFGNTYAAGDVNVNVELAELSSSLEGYLFYTNDKGKEVPMAGTIVRIVFDDIDTETKIFAESFENEVEVGEDGKFVFENLPATGNGNYKLVLIGAAKDPSFGVYDYTAITPALAKGSKAVINTRIVYSMAAATADPDFIILPYVGKIADATKSVTIKFSKDIDKSKITPSTIDAGKPATIVWGKNSVELKPVGSWKDDYVWITFNDLYSIFGDKLGDDDGIDFAYFYVDNSVNIADRTAKAITAVATPGSIALEWDTIAGAVDYELYQRVKGTNSWGIPTDGFGNSGTKITHSVSVSMNVATTYQFMVRAIGGGTYASASNFSEVKEIANAVIDLNTYCPVSATVSVLAGGDGICDDWCRTNLSETKCLAWKNSHCSFNVNLLDGLCSTERDTFCAIGANINSIYCGGDYVSDYCSVDINVDYDDGYCNNYCLGNMNDKDDSFSPGCDGWVVDYCDTDYGLGKDTDFCDP